MEAIVPVKKYNLFKLREEMITDRYINSLVKKFEDTSLPKYQWTHVMHLIVAAYYLRHNSYDQSFVLLRKNIMKYNKSKGVPNTYDSGYHETLTVFWLKIVKHYLAYEPDDQSMSYLIRKVIRGPLTDKNLPLKYYSNEVLMSPAAREKFVDPDLSPFEF